MDITIAFCILQNLSQDLSSMAAIIDRENGKMCKHLMGVAIRRERRQICWTRKAMEATATTEALPRAMFHRFIDFPAEIQLLVWEAATQPPSCQNVIAIWKTARTPNRKETAKGYEKMPGTHSCDPAGLWFSGDDLGLWTACRTSRAAVQRVYDKAYQHLLPQTERQNRNNACTEYVDPDKLAMQCRRISRLNRTGIRFQARVRLLDYIMKRAFLAAEYEVRKHEQLQLQTQTGAQDHAGEDESADLARMDDAAATPPQKENVLAEILREIYELREGDQPRRAEDGPIPSTYLKRLCPELRMGYMLGVPWG